MCIGDGCRGESSLTGNFTYLMHTKREPGLNRILEGRQEEGGPGDLRRALEGCDGMVYEGALATPGQWPGPKK